MTGIEFEVAVVWATATRMDGWCGTAEFRAEDTRLWLQGGWLDAMRLILGRRWLGIHWDALFTCIALLWVSYLGLSETVVTLTCRYVHGTVNLRVDA